MQKDAINNINIISEKVLITPESLKKKFPLNKKIEKQITKSRQIISNIINKKDHRLLVVCGPCSIHDPNAALEYAQNLKNISDKLQDQLYIVMRVYFEKPRTTIGWKGLINDPYMDNSFDMEAGLHIARKLIIELLRLDLPLAKEALDPNTPQYIGDLFSWAAIGARTTESQTHREMASGLSMPIGFKNSTDGSLNTAINAMSASAMSHCFVGINQKGQVSLLKTKGNTNSHIILRGGKKPNYYIKNIMQCEEEMIKSRIKPSIMIDCSHGNSNKNYLLQPNVADNITTQIEQGNQSIIGLMIESNIKEGNQSPNKIKNKMLYGVSVTDPCINWIMTEKLLINTYQRLKLILKKRTLTKI